MDHQWRPGPIQGQVCPNCSVSHYPFCPPPPRYPYEPHPSFQTPGFNPYASPVGYAPNRNDGFGDPSLWHRNPDWDRRPHGQLPPLPYRPPLYEHGNPNSYVGEGDRNLKRPRIDDSNSASEDERRLKLIRDHGCALSKPPEEQSHGRPGFTGSHNQNNGFHSDVNHGELHKGEKDVFLHPQNGEFPPYQYNQPNNVDPQHHLPPPPLPGQHHRDSWHGDPHLSKPLPQTYATQHPGHMRHEFPSQEGNQAQVGHEFPSQEGNQVGQQHMYAVSQRGTSNMNARGAYHPHPYPINSGNMGPMEASRFFGGQPPLPSSPPPPLPSEPPMNPSSGMKTYFSPPKPHASLFPVPTSSFAMAPSSYPPVPEAHSLPQPYFHDKSRPQSSTAFPLKEPSKHQLGDARPFSLKQLSADKPKVIDASHLFRQPHRATRLDHIVIILRGLPGSGKSYLAKMLRDLEVECGGDAPRIHSMDDYFMTEVEKVEDNDALKSSSSGIGKKPIMKKVMEYCYEPEMEEAYRSSMLKAFKKTVEEGVFTFIIVDDRNLRVADFAQFWATAKRSGYEVYILEAPYKDPAGCAARNVHGFTQEDIEKMAEQWEEAPSLYMQLDVKSLFHGDDLKESNIQEVDMDMEDEDLGDILPAMQGREAEKVVESPVRDDASDDGSTKNGKRWIPKEEHPTEEVRDLGKSKWSEDYDEGDNDQTDNLKGNVNALSGILHAYGKEGKSVHWGDQVGNTGFSIGAARKASVLSLVTGPGAGYNLKSNPLPQEENLTTQNSLEPKKHSAFQERIRAERESFKAVFDRRRQRIGGLDVEEE